MPSSRQATISTTAAKRTLGMAVPSATPASPSGPARTRLRTRLSTPAPRNVSDGSTGFPSPISTGRATPRTGRKIRLEIMRIWSTTPAGPSNEASIHQPMKRGRVGLERKPSGGVQHGDVDAEGKDRADHVPLEARQPDAHPRIAAVHEQQADREVDRRSDDLDRGQDDERRREHEQADGHPEA